MSQSTNFVDLWSILIIHTTKAPFDSKKIGHRNLFRGKTLRVSSSSVNTMLPHSAMPSEIGMIKVFIFFPDYIENVRAHHHTHHTHTYASVLNNTRSKTKTKTNYILLAPTISFFFTRTHYIF